ncbi:glutathione S-transferase [Stella humosa]|uniref:Glutathione S-transferase n=1 Tax=Stella humosa TaxID=94 RepID=A0A3N1KWA9_9PROT|nr:glutathione S-transferase [Stella humosa]ROP83517.1 glutathione S-transferase [Stella humosa]BBK33210.1 glutathione S-transferase [Stella humosa]
MAEFKLHCFAQSGNAYKVGLMLSLAGADWEPVYVDFFGGVTRTEEWRGAVNEMGEVPILEYRGLRLTQSGVILDYLADALGRFGGRDAAERREIWRWILFDNHKFTSYFVTHRWLRAFAETAPAPEVLAFLRARIDAAFAVVEKHLADRPFMLGDRLTIVDFSLVGYLYFPSEETGYDLPASHPNIAAWTRRLMAEPGWRHPYDMLPGEQIKPRRTYPPGQ